MGDRLLFAKDRLRAIWNMIKKRAVITVFITKRSHSFYFSCFNLELKRKKKNRLYYHPKLERIYEFLLYFTSLFFDVTVINLMPNYGLSPKRCHVVTIHHELGHSFSDREKEIDNKLFNKIEKVLNDSSKLVYLTYALRKEDCEFCKSRMEKQFIVLPHNFTEEKNIKLTKEAHNYYDLISVGTSQKRKNWPAFFDLMLMLDRVLAVKLIVDQDFERKYFKELIAVRNKGHQVSVVSEVNRDELITIYSSAKYYLQVSTYEGFCVPIVEAMYYGCDVLALQTEILEEIYSDHFTLCENIFEIKKKIEKNERPGVNRRELKNSFFRFDDYFENLERFANGRS